MKPTKYMTWIRPSVPKGSNGNSSSAQSLHIGNYYGAIEKFIQLSWEKQFLVADSSTLSWPDSCLDSVNIIRSTAAYYALNVLGDNGYMYLQSWGRNKAFYELYTLLNSFTKVKDMMIELERRKTIEGRSYNIDELDCLDFSYPNHMAADIMLANPDQIPIGESNRWNIEYAQKLIQKINEKILDPKQKLTIPKILLSEDEDRQNILWTCGTGVKMSKSDDNYLSVFVSQEERKNEIEKIASLPVSQYLLKVIDPSMPVTNKFEYNKKQIFELLENTFREKNIIYDQIKEDETFLYSLLHEGNEKHAKQADAVMERIRPIFFNWYKQVERYSQSYEERVMTVTS